MNECSADNARAMDGLAGCAFVKFVTSCVWESGLCDCLVRSMPLNQTMNLFEFLRCHCCWSSHRFGDRVHCVKRSSFAMREKGKCVWRPAKEALLRNQQKNKAIKEAIFAGPWQWCHWKTSQRSKRSNAFVIATKQITNRWLTVDGLSRSNSKYMELVNS